MSATCCRCVFNVFADFQLANFVTQRYAERELEVKSDVRAFMMTDPEMAHLPMSMLETHVKKSAYETQRPAGRVR